MELAKIQRAVEMTAQCKSVERNWRAPEDSRWSAVLWCNAIGDFVTGYGPDAWVAVQASHAEKARLEIARRLTAAQG